MITDGGSIDSQIELNECWKVITTCDKCERVFFFASRGPLEFNLDKHGPEAFIDFFPDMNLDVKLWGHYHKTKPD